MKKIQEAIEVLEKELKFISSITHPYNPEDEGKRKKKQTFEFLLLILSRLGDREWIKLCPDNCKYLNPPENHPYTKGHYCELFKTALFHLNYHPRLCRNENCLYLATALQEALVKGE